MLCSIANTALFERGILTDDKGIRTRAEVSSVILPAVLNYEKVVEEVGRQALICRSAPSQVWKYLGSTWSHSAYTRRVKETKREAETAALVKATGIVPAMTVPM